jgi:hypothetical protein
MAPTLVLVLMLRVLQLVLRNTGTATVAFSQPQSPRRSGKRQWWWWGAELQLF